MKNSVDDIKEITLPIVYDERGSLQILQENQLPLDQIKRTFIIKTKNNEKRGYHSHKECSQLMVCLQGEINIFCDDSQRKRAFSLKETDSIIVPPGIWSYQEYKKKLNILAVWCDMDFEEDDYIRDYQAFLLSKK